MPHRREMKNLNRRRSSRPKRGSKYKLVYLPSSRTVSEACSSSRLASEVEKRTRDEKTDSSDELLAQTPPIKWWFPLIDYSSDSGDGEID